MINFRARATTHSRADRGRIALLLCGLAYFALASTSCSTAGRQSADAMTAEAIAEAETAAAIEPIEALPTPAELAAERAAWAFHLRAGREHFLFKRYPEAEGEFVIAMRLAHVFGPATQRELTSLFNLESVAEKYGSKPEDLIRVSRVILPIAIELRGSSHPSVAHHSAALGTALVAVGDFEDARVPLERALAIVHDQKGDDSLDAASLHAQLARVAQGTGDLSAAETEIQLAIDIVERVLGPDDPALTPHVQALAQFMTEADRTEEAEAAYLRLTRLAAAQSELSEAVALNNLASFYLATKRPAEAEPLALRALELIEAAEGPEVLTAATLDTVGVALLSQGKYQDAEVHLARAYQLGSDTSEAVSQEIRKHYAQLLRATQRESEASDVEAGRPLAAAPVSEASVPAATAPQPAVSEAAAPDAAVPDATASGPAAMPPSTSPAEASGSSEAESQPAADDTASDGEDSAD